MTIYGAAPATQMAADYKVAQAGTIKPESTGPDRRWKQLQSFVVGRNWSSVREARALERDWCACKLNRLPFNATGEFIDGIWRVHEFAWHMEAILFWDRFEGRRSVYAATQCRKSAGLCCLALIHIADILCARVLVVHSLSFCTPRHDRGQPLVAPS